MGMWDKPAARDGRLRLVALWALLAGTAAVVPVFATSGSPAQASALALPQLTARAALARPQLIARAALARPQLTARAALARPQLTAKATATPALGFSHGVIVDEQWPGFEPDLALSANGTIYTSTPQGFVGTISPVWSSRDGGNSYQMVPGNVFSAKQQTCVGGGDTDLYTDPGNELYFSDLQGLTNISTSASPDGGATWSTNCAGAPNTPDDRMWYAGSGSLAANNLVLFNDYDATVTGANPASPGSNQLVETVSTNGTTFLPVRNNNLSALTGDCAGAAVQDCVTNNEGISGNQVVDQFHSSPSSSNVYIAHTTSTNEVGVRVAEGQVNLTGPTPTANWTASPNLVGSLCPGSATTSDGSLSCEDSSGNATAAAVGENFATIAQDQAGYLYVAFTYAPARTTTSTTGATTTQTGPEQIYVVHSLEPAPADPSKITWSAPEQITGAGVSAGTNTFPWIAAGSQGRIDVGYYHSDETSEGGLYGASNLNKAEWTVQMAQSINALDATPTLTTTEVSEGPVKYGQICTNGIGCTTGGDRSLGDFLQVKPDAQGAAVISYVYDTSAASSATQAVGPEAVSRQLSGPSLYASVGNITQGSGPGVPMGSVSDPTGDAFYSHLGTRTPASDNLDLTGASLTNGTTATGAPALVATINVKSLASLSTGTSEGGPDGSWMLRWTQVVPGQAGNGHIYYAGMDNNQGVGIASTPTFFVGDQTTESAQPALLTYPQTTLLSAADGSYNSVNGTITLRIPVSDVGSPAAGTVLHSITAFTATSTTPQSNQTQFNQIDATSPFDVVVGAAGTVGSATAAPTSSATVTPNGMVVAPTPAPSPTTPSSGHPAPKPKPKPTHPRKHKSGPKPSRCPAATGTLTPTHIGPLALGMTRAQTRGRLHRHSTHGRRQMDFFCLSPMGVRAAYGYPAELRRLHAGGRLNGRVVVILTGNRRYQLEGLRIGQRVRLPVGLDPIGPVQVGLNTWYVIHDGPNDGVLKVRHGIIEEIGLTPRALARNRAAIRILFNDLI